MTGDSHEVELRGQELSELILREALEKVLYMGESGESDLTTTTPPPPPPPIRADRQCEHLQASELSSSESRELFVAAGAADCAVSRSEAVKGSSRQMMAPLESSSGGEVQEMAEEMAPTASIGETAEKENSAEEESASKTQTESEIEAPPAGGDELHRSGHDEEESRGDLASGGENLDEEKMQQVELLQVEEAKVCANRKEEDDDEEEEEEEEEEGAKVKSEAAAEKRQQQQLEMITKQTSDACSTSSGNSSGSLGLADDDDDDDDERDDERNGEQQQQQQQHDDVGHEDEEDFCGEMASNSNLRRLRMDTVEDVSICEQNRGSMEAARKLFGELEARQRQHQHQHQQQHRPESGRRCRLLQWGAPLRNGRSSAPPMVVACQAVRADGSPNAAAAAAATSGELSTSPTSGRARSSGFLNGASRVEPEPEPEPDGELDCESRARPEITIVRRSGSSVSGSGRGFGQTLVCSVSPTELSDAPNGHQQQQLAVYPIDGEEMRQCREAFRQNRRLIQEQQERAANSSSGQESGQDGAAAAAAASASSQQQQLDGGSRSSRVQSILLQRQQWSVCSRCQKRLYPLDQLELDFTRARLNIHRNCFKCQICSTLLRLETYKAMDAKLYCPAHIRCANPGGGATQSGATWP